MPWREKFFLASTFFLCILVERRGLLSISAEKLGKYIRCQTNASNQVPDDAKAVDP